jgi:peptide/nickel transport system substrate-binding protein
VKLSKKVMATVALTVPLSFAVASFSATTSNAARIQDGGTLTVSQEQPFDQIFIPNLSSIWYTSNIVQWAFDGLFMFDKNYNIQNDLASAYTWSPDHMTLTIRLKKNAVWSDGQPIISDDVLLYLDFLASKVYNTTFQGEYESLVDDIKGAQDIMNGKATSFAKTGGFVKVNDKEFKIHFAKKNIHELMFNVMYWYPLPSHVLKNIPFSQWEDMAYDKHPTVTSGPFLIDQVNGRDNVVMKANPRYIFGKPHIDEIIFKTVNADVATGELAAGQIDYEMSGIQPKDVAKLQSIKNVTLYKPVDQGYYYLGLKDNKKFFSDVRVRQALTYGIDRQALVNGVLKGYGQVANSPVTPAQWGYIGEKQGLNPYKYNVAKANQLLDAAGYKKKDKNGYRLVPGTNNPITLTLGYPSKDPKRVIAAQAIASDLKKIGIKVQLEVFGDSTTMYNKVQAGQLDMWMGGWVQLGAYQDVRSLWRSNMAYNTGFEDWQDKRADAILDAMYSDKAANTAYYKQELAEFQKYVNQQMPVVLLFYDDLLYAINNRVHIPSNDWNPLQPFNPYQWWLA